MPSCENMSAESNLFFGNIGMHFYNDYYVGQGTLNLIYNVKTIEDDI